MDIQIAVVATKSYYYTNTGVEKDGQDICMKSLEDFVDSGVRIPRQSAYIAFISLPLLISHLKGPLYDEDNSAAFWLQESHRLQEERCHLSGNIQ